MNMKNKNGALILSAALLGTGMANAAIIADIGGDYASASGYVAGTTAPTAAPSGWTYLSSTAAIGGTESALTAQTEIGNGGNDGFGVVGIGTYTVGVLGGTTGGAQYEMYDDGYDGNGGNRPLGNEGVVGTDLLLQPGDDSGTEYMIVRYTFSAADIQVGTKASISGSFRELTGRTNKNTDSITASVYLNTTSLFSAVGGDDGNGNGYLLQADGTFNITGLTVAEGDSVSFVVYGNGNATSDETALNGTIEVVPEPATLGLIVAFGGAMLFLRRHFKS